MMAQPVPHQPIDRKRVKVYELRNNDWFDRGTGFCSATFVPTDDDEVKEPRVIVESEDEPERLLLDTRITREDGFQRQQDTLIVWTEPTTGLDMALSFQEAEGCLLIWNFISDIQQSLAVTVPDDSLSEDLAMDIPPTITLPPAELGALQDLENNMRIMSSTAGGRDALASCIMAEDYIRKLIPLVDMAEDLESLADLHHLCNIVKIILLLNDTSIIEHAVSDECVLGVVGALEYDPDFPSHKANHRQWLNNQGRYKEVVRIQDDGIRKKIHQTYRLQYLKDVVLARILDDPTFSVLNSLIFFNQVDIVQHLQTNAGFLGDLFGIFTDSTEALLRKKQAVLFIQQCCAIAKNLQPPARMTLYNNFLSHGLLHVINFGLRNPDVSVRVGATDILVSMIDHDPQMIRQTIYRQMHEHQPQLTDTLIDLLLVEVDLGIKSQVSDALKVLLDPVGPNQLTAAENNPNGNVNGGPGAKGANGEAQLRARLLQTQTDPQQELFLSHFYEHSAIRLFKPLMDLENRRDLEFNVLNDGIYNYLNDILCFFIRQHHHRCKFFMMQHNLALRFVQLLDCRVKHLQLVAVRFFRQLIAMRDEFYIRHIMEKRLIDPILDLLNRCLPRDNLLCSACLEFFDFFTKEDLGDLTKHLVEAYREKLQALSYMPTFRDLLNGKYPQNGQQNQPAHPVLNSHSHAANQQVAVSTDHDVLGGISASRGANGVHSALMNSILDPEEEEYWNGEDEDDEMVLSSNSHSITGESPVLKQLVDYPSDEEGDDGGDGDGAGKENQAGNKSSAVLSDEEQESAGAGADAAGSAVQPPSAHLSGTPPERLSEKRRREEDDDDELGKLMRQNSKRRNSRSNSATNNSSATAAAASAAHKKKASTNGNGNGNGVDATTTATAPGATPAKKISINITSSLSPKTAAAGAIATPADDPPGEEQDDI